MNVMGLDFIPAYSESASHVPTCIMLSIKQNRSRRFFLVFVSEHIAASCVVKSGSGSWLNPLLFTHDPYVCVCVCVCVGWVWVWLCKSCGCACVVIIHIRANVAVKNDLPAFIKCNNQHRLRDTDLKTWLLCFKWTQNAFKWFMNLFWFSAFSSLMRFLGCLFLLHSWLLLLLHFQT